MMVKFDWNLIIYVISKKVDKYLEEAISNIRDDREITRELLDDAIKWLSKDESRHQQIGLVVSKYVETLQRSNEQLVKIIALLQKRESKSENLTNEDKQELFDLIQGNGTDGWTGLRATLS